MTIIYEERLSDSPHVEKIMHGWTLSDGSSVRPAECHWHIVIARHNGREQLLVVGPLTTAGIASWGDGAEILWIKFKLGTFMPHLSPRDSLDKETPLPGAASNSFWLKGSAWKLPDYNNVETFIDRLVRQEVLVHDSVVSAVLDGHPPELTPRTVRHRFLRATGLTQLYIYQAERAQRAEELIRQGIPILDTVFEAGYYDQPHLTRSLKQFTGHTPGQIVQLSEPA